MFPFNGFDAISGSFDRDVVCGAPAGVRAAQSIFCWGCPGSLEVRHGKYTGECLSDSIPVREVFWVHWLLVDLSVDFSKYVKSAVVPIPLLLGGWVQGAPRLLVPFFQQGFEVFCVIRCL